ncbi:MAG: YraN family protein [Bauldia sp.]
MAPDLSPGERRRARERSGRSAEALAGLFLRLKGYRLLERRFKTPVGEVDLIASRGDTVAFVEVKRRADADAAIAAVTPAARARIARAAEAWLARHPEAADRGLRFDIVVVVPWRLPRHLPAAFDADGR